ncbi:protein-glutamate O-methyltransferase CheR [uncultured Draconibacterium sp.]|uniref:CheR family methyltransferase n=1 Tax=uncultured Draconibacterium sp. TaxID=1573823 RepID=UPI00321706F3
MQNSVYNKILLHLKAKESFDFEAYKLPMLIRRIDNRILRMHFGTPELYYTLLQNNQEEAKELVNNFMINVSQFFRDSYTFEVIKKRILPELITQTIAAGRNSLRVWSAGCARGEEAYSLAILIDEYCKKEKLEIDVDIFATDYDSSALEFAKKGEYDQSSVEEVKLKYLKQFFKQTNDKYIINTVLKNKVHFSQYNLLDQNSYAPSDSIYGEFDLILCRNVLIYFNEEYQNLIFEKLYKSCIMDGILILGDAEIPPKHFGNKFQQIDDFCKTYRKKHNGH